MVYACAFICLVFNARACYRDYWLCVFVCLLLCCFIVFMDPSLTPSPPRVIAFLFPLPFAFLRAAWFLGEVSWAIQESRISWIPDFSSIYQKVLPWYMNIHDFLGVHSMALGNWMQWWMRSRHTRIRIMGLVVTARNPHCSLRHSPGCRIWTRVTGRVWTFMHWILQWWCSG